MQIIKHFVLITFTEPITEIHGGPDLFINKGSTINLTCVVKFAPEPPPAMVWSHNQEVSVEFYTAFNSIGMANCARTYSSSCTHVTLQVLHCYTLVLASAACVSISSAVFNVTAENHLSTSFRTAHCFVCLLRALAFDSPAIAAVSQLSEDKTKYLSNRFHYHPSGFLHRGAFLFRFSIFFFLVHG